LPGGRHIITCPSDGSLRLWDLKSGTQIGEDWQHEDDVGLQAMALSPNGKTIACGSNDWKVRLWDVETRKVIAKWWRMMCLMVPSTSTTTLSKASFYCL